MIPQGYQTCISTLKSRIFLGEYTERRYVQEIDAYRDVIVLHNSEEDLKKDLESVLKSLQHIRSSIWFGFSCVPDTNKYNLWVELSGVAFGHYWFQIKHVRLTVNELFCQVKVLRSVQAEVVDNSPLSFTQGLECARNVLGVRRVENEENARSSSGTRTTNDTENAVNRRSRDPQTSDSNPVDPSIFKDFKNVSFDQIRNLLLNDDARVNLLKLTLLCFCYTVIGMAKFMYESLVVMSNIIVFTGDVTVKSMNAVARLIDSVSPIVLAIINFFGRIVTGLYMLIAMLCGCVPQMASDQGPVYRPDRTPPRRALMYR